MYQLILKSISLNEMYNQYWPWKYLHVRRHEKGILSLQICVCSLYRFMDIQINLKVK